MLNNEQLNAVNSEEKHLLILAGAGTGKTTVLIERIKRLLLTNKASEILVITFTKSASLEIKKRSMNEELGTYTFDSYCYKMLSDKGEIKIIKNEDSPFSIKETMEFQRYQSIPSLSIPKKFYEYLEYKSDNNLIDFYDLEKLFLEKHKTKDFSYKHILIDEAQDINNLQWEIIKKIKSENTSLFMVGDPDQSIYRFRGSNPNILTKFIYEFKAKIIPLTTNYRSSKGIIKAANNLIRTNVFRINKTLIAFDSKEYTNGYGIFNDEFEEYLKVEEIIKYYHNLNVFDIAIIYRTHKRSSVLKSLKIIYKNVSFLTIHEAKGLEFEVVIILGYAKRDLERIYNYLSLEEERRLMFVAITRAKKHLIISGIKKRPYFVKEAKLKRLF